MDYSSISLIDRIKGAYASLRPSEQKVADFITKDVESAVNMTIQELSANTLVSQPTIIRFVKALGFTGYKSFRFELFKSLESHHDDIPFTQSSHNFSHLGNFDLKPWDKLSDLPLREFHQSVGLLDDMLRSMIPAELEKACMALSKARTIDILGVENSFTPASDLLTKLTYLGLNARFHSDPYLQLISASHLDKDDAAVAFSHSGSSIDTVKALKLAKNAGAATIAITSTKNPMISKYADVCLFTGGADIKIYGSAIFSRVPDLAACDLIYTGIILSDHDRFSKISIRAALS